MMKYIALLLLAIFFHVEIDAQNKGPVISFDNQAHNFGTIKEVDGVVSVSFELTNTGDAPLIINRVSSTCGCAASEWPREPILPGQSATILASYDPRGRPGVFNQRITLFTNATGTGTVLTLRGQVTPRPKSLDDIYRRRIGQIGVTNSHLSLGRVYVNQIRTDTLKIYNFGDKNVRVSFDRVPQYLTVETSSRSLRPQQGGEIIFTFDASKANDWGFVINRIRMQVNNENLQGNLITITANIEEDFSSLSQEELANAPNIEFNEINKDFGTVDEGDTIEHEFGFTNTGNSDLIIRRIRSSCGCTTVAPKDPVVKPGEQSSLSASFRTSGFPGRQTKTITVITNDPEKSTVVLRLSGTVTKK